MKSRFLLACAAISLAASSVHAAVEFSKPPAVAREGDKFVVKFSVSAVTDVEVRVVDGAGKVVRRLVAGRLGPKAPAPLVRDLLEQSIAWDGKDDAGQPVTADAKLKAVVSLGLTPKLDRVIGSNPGDLGGVRALAVGPDGRLYVFHCYGGQHPNDSSAACAVFDRSGKYLRTILPFPADLPDEKLAGIRRLDTGSGKAPYIYQPETRSYLPGLGDLPNHRAVVSADGKWLAFVGIQEGPRPFAQPGEARLTVVGTDGSVPEAGVLRTLLHPLTDAAASLALSPDGKTIYAAGIRVGLHPNGAAANFACDVCDHAGSTWDHTIPDPFVFHFGWNDPQVRVLVGGEKFGYSRPTSQPDEMTAARKDRDGKKLVEPISVATGAEGNVYIADPGQDAVVVVTSPEGRNGRCDFVKRIEVRQPQRVEVNKKTGAIYVLSGEKEIELLKLASLADPKVVARLPVNKSERGYPPTRRPIIALDDNADPAIIWIGQPFWRVEDKGSSFGNPIDLRDPARVGQPATAAVMEMSIDRVHGWLYVNNGQRMNVATGEWEPIKTVGGRMWPSSTPGSANGNAGRDGNYYVDRGAGGAWLYRFGPDMKLMPFPNSIDKDNEGRIHGAARNRGVGLTADYRGNVYALWKSAGAGKTEEYFHKAASLVKYDPQGRAISEPLIDCQIPSIYSPRVDRAGNVYLALGLRPGKELLVPGLAGQVPDSPADPAAVNRVNAYPLVYGSVAKFPPAGGMIRDSIPDGVECNTGPGVPMRVKGAEWIVPGISLAGSFAAPKLAPGTVITCVCEFPNIDVDEFARTFYPDSARCRVGILDAAGNEICTFGSYGNGDSAGPGGLVPGPAIPMWWPQAVAVDDERAYIGDRLNRRILVVKLDYAARVECQIR